MSLIESKEAHIGGSGEGNRKEEMMWLESQKKVSKFFFFEV